MRLLRGNLICGYITLCTSQCKDLKAVLPHCSICTTCTGRSTAHRISIHSLVVAQSMLDGTHCTTHLMLVEQALTLMQKALTLMEQALTLMQQALTLMQQALSISWLFQLP